MRLPQFIKRGWQGRYGRRRSVRRPHRPVAHSEMYPQAHQGGYMISPQSQARPLPGWAQVNGFRGETNTPGQDGEPDRVRTSLTCATGRCSWTCGIVLKTLLVVFNDPQSRTERTLGRCRAMSRRSIRVRRESNSRRPRTFHRDLLRQIALGHRRGHLDVAHLTGWRHYREHVETTVRTAYRVFMKATRALHTLLCACRLFVQRMIGPS